MASNRPSLPSGPACRLIAGVVQQRSPASYSDADSTNADLRAQRGRQPAEAGIFSAPLAFTVAACLGAIKQAVVTEQRYEPCQPPGLNQVYIIFDSTTFDSRENVV